MCTNPLPNIMPFATAFVHLPCSATMRPNCLPTTRPAVASRTLLRALPRATTFLGRPTRAYVSRTPTRVAHSCGSRRAGARRARHGACSPVVMSATEPGGEQPDAKELAKLYGGSYLGTSIAMSVVSYGVLYALVYVGVDVRSLTNSFGNWLASTPLGRPSALDNVSDAASAAAIAYVAHKVTSPLRFPLTIAATPLVARIFSSKQQDAGDENKPPPST